MGLGRDSETFEFEYEKGTLILDMIDPKSGQAIWHGTATDEVNFSHSLEKREVKLNEAVARMLQGLPTK